MRIGSLFSGYSGLDMAVAAHYQATVAWHVEFDRHPSAILAHHYPDVPNYGDITRVDWSAIEPVDVLTGGFPCQDVSHAGKRAGIKPGTRSGLWSHFAYAIDQLRPRLVVIENVKGLLSAEAHSDLERDCWCVGDERDSHLRALGAVLGDLADLGFSAEWASVRASDAGACHRRERVFIVAAPHAGRGQLPWAAVDADRLPEPAERGDGPVTLLSTPTTMDHLEPRTGEALDYVLRRGEPDGAPRRSTGNLREDVVRLLPTPAVNDMGAGKTVEGWDAWTDAMRAKHGNGNGHGKSLAIEAQRLLPTPRATDGEKGGPNQTNGRGVRDSLPGVVPLLPTPTSRDHKGRNQRNDTTCLPGAVATGFGPYAPAIARWGAVLGRPAPSPTEPGKDGRPRLSPRFVEWMQGLPEGWVTDTGIPRNAQLKALGNGVCPQQAILALSILLPRLEQP